MLLRRIKSHIEKENWFAVFIDFCIVVLGLFMGLQANDWRQARLDNIAEVELLERMHFDVEAASADLAAFAGFYRKRYSSLDSLEKLFFGEEILRPLSEKECQLILSAHMLRHPPAKLPTLTEVLLGGKLDLIRDEQLRRKIILLQQSNANIRDHLDLLISRNINFRSAYPGLMKGNPFRPVVSDDCDHTGMADSRAFLNDLSGQLGRIKGFFNLIIKPMENDIQSLHDELDNVVGWEHEEPKE
ncbi:MAG: hypothetical protein AB8G18_07750 [Gammaproteobacteria bacterium]